MNKIERYLGRLAIFGVLLAVGCVGLLIALEAYYTHATQVAENTASVAPLNKESLRNISVPQFNTDVKFRQFSLAAPGATKVTLSADFNKWGENELVLPSPRSGYFEISVALPPGEYAYTFVVDGQERPDPKNNDRRTLPDGRTVCMRTVK